MPVFPSLTQNSVPGFGSLSNLRSHLGVTVSRVGVLLLICTFLSPWTRNTPSLKQTWPSPKLEHCTSTAADPRESLAFNNTSSGSAPLNAVNDIKAQETR